MSPAAILLTCISRRTKGLLGAAALVGVVGRLAVYATAVSALGDRVSAAIVVGAATAAIWLAQRLLLAALRAALDDDLFRATSRALLEADVVETPREDLHRVVWEGHARARSAIGQAMPALAADAVALAILAPAVAMSLPSRVVLAAVLALGVVLLSVVVLRRAIASREDALLASLNRVIDTVQGVVDGRLEIVARGGEEAHARALEELLATYRREARRAAIGAAVLGRVPLAAGIVVAGLVAFVDASTRDTLGLAVLGQALVLAAAVPPLVSVVMHTNQIVRDAVVLRPFADLFSGAREGDRRTGDRKKVDVPAAVVARGLAFAYHEGRERVLEDVSFEWPAKGVLVLTGANGSGKSTLLRLLLGLRMPSEGSLTVGGTAIADIELVSYRRQAALLPQRPYLGQPHSTVREAMRFANPEMRDGALEEVLAKVAVKVSLDDAIGELSAGQRQRIALARVLVQEASIVLLDEPDANLDREGITLVAGLIREMARAGKMVAVAAHTRELAELDGVPTITVSLEGRGSRDTKDRSGRLGAAG